MRRSLLLAIMLLGVAGGALLGGCGSSAKTVTVANAPTYSQATGTTSGPQTGTSSSTTTPATTSTSASSTGGTAAGTSTRKAPAPAFVPQGQGSEGPTPGSILQAQGFHANNSAEYHTNQALRVLIGTRISSGDGYNQKAFFFVNGRYIGTDAKVASAMIKVVSQGDTEITLAYTLYRRGDPLLNPSGEAKVRFELNNGKLVPLDPIPPAESSSGLSRL